MSIHRYIDGASYRTIRKQENLCFGINANSRVDDDDDDGGDDDDGHDDDNYECSRLFISTAKILKQQQK